MLRTRLITALLLAPLILAIVFLGEPWLSLLIGIVAFLALVEVVALLDAAVYEPPQVLAIVAGMALTAAGLVSANAGSIGGVVTTLLTALDPPGLVAATLSRPCSCSRWCRRCAPTRAPASRRGRRRHSASRTSASSCRPSCSSRASPRPVDRGTRRSVLGLGSGAAWALTLVLVVWGYDAGAYATGRLIGHRRSSTTSARQRRSRASPAGWCWRRSPPTSAPC